MPSKPDVSNRPSMKPDLPGKPPVTPMPDPCNPVANPSLADCPDQRPQPPRDQKAPQPTDATQRSKAPQPRQRRL